MTGAEPIEPGTGGHPTAPGGGAFIFRNSWGKDWARLRGRHGGGYGTLFFDYVRDNALEAYG